MAWWKNLIRRLVPRAWGGFVSWRAVGAATPAAQEVESQAKAPVAPLVKSRPFSLEQNYELMEDQNRLDSLFTDMRRFLFDAESHATQPDQLPAVWRERGRIDPQRPYFYMKPFNKTGLLFERSGSGWVVSRAEKIAKEDTFVRSSVTWDRVTMYAAKNGKGSPRVTSERLGLEKVSFAVYEQILQDSLNKEWTGETVS